MLLPYFFMAAIKATFSNLEYWVQIKWVSECKVEPYRHFPKDDESCAK